MFGGRIIVATDREREMATMRARYAALRGNKKIETAPIEKKESAEEEIPIIQSRAVKKTNPYIKLIRSDIENLIARIKKFLGIKPEAKSKPLNISWLEKNNRRFFK